MQRFDAFTTLTVFISFTFHRLCSRSNRLLARPHDHEHTSVLHVPWRCLQVVPPFTPLAPLPVHRLQHNLIHLHRSATTLDQLQHDKALPILPEPPPSCTFSVPCWEAVAMVFSRTTEETCSSRMRAKDRLTLPSTATTPDRTTRQSPVADVSSNSGRLVTDDTRPWVWQKDAATWCVGRGRW